jgi:hypothetical protein
MGMRIGVHAALQHDSLSLHSCLAVRDVRRDARWNRWNETDKALAKVLPGGNNVT